MTALSRFPDLPAESAAFEDLRRWLDPLGRRTTAADDFFDVCALESEDKPMPEPYRRLLVHDSDMTSTLERYYGERPCLEVLAKLRRGTGLFRKVLLRGTGAGRVMELGAIRIELDVLPSRARFAVLEGARPLGGILGDHSVGFLSRPQSFFSLRAGAGLQRLLGLEREQTLYGRKNFLLTESGDVLAEVVEILPPVGPS